MTFIFRNDIPAAANNPSDDQPKMLTNNISTEAILAVDHISFNAANGGNHLQTHFPLFSSPTVVNGSGTQGSVAYPAAGVADPARAQYYFKNDNTNLILSSIRAFGSFIVNIATVTFINSFNCASIAIVPGPTATVTFIANCITGNNYVVLCTTNSAITAINYNIISSTSLQFTYNGSGSPTNTVTSFAILQV